jgi:hypothetical protein
MSIAIIHAIVPKRAAANLTETEIETVADDLIDAGADLSSIDACVLALYGRGYTGKRIGKCISGAMIEARTRII